MTSNRAVPPSLLLTLAVLGAAAPVVEAHAGRRYVVSDLGAVGDGRTKNTAAIQASIDRCSAEGGGTVVVPEGTFLTGALFLKERVRLEIEARGVLLGTTDPEDYPQVPTRWEGIEREWTSALVNAVDLRDVEVSGAGIIDGAGDKWLERFPRQPPPRQSQTENAAPAADLRSGRPRLICFQNCRGVRLVRLTLRNQAAWCVHVLYSQNVVLEDLTIRAAHTIPSSDGIDVDSSRRVRIRRCDIDVNDDCISIKSGKDTDGLRVNRPSQDVVIEDCRFGYGHGGVAMGSETSGGIRNVLVRRCVAEADNWAPIRFKSQPSRGGIVENITYQDIQLHDTRQAFEFNMEWRMVPPVAPPAAVLPIVRNVKLIDITGTVGSGGLIHGLKDSPIEGVTFRRCKLSARKGLVLQYVRSLDLSGLVLAVSEGEAILRRE